MRSASYQPSDCCEGCDCPFETDNPNEPCWGKVDVVEITYEGDPIHACEGHRDYYYDYIYIKEE